MDERKKMLPTHQSAFESIRKVNQQGQDFWSARDFQIILEYKEWRKFLGVIEKAKEACVNSGQNIADHFVQVDKMVTIGSEAERKIDDLSLSRYACYLIVQNADPSKPIVALGQTYFAVQTRKQEILDQAGYQNLRTEDERRIFLRNQLKVHNQQLAGAARNAGVIKPVDYAIFQDHGYKGLYGGLTTKNIHSRKRLKKGQQILDHMGSTELAANQTHYEVGRKVRKIIGEIGGTMPENLPAVESIKAIERKQNKQLKQK